jgi:uncharacterized protein (DUF362 family)
MMSQLNSDVAITRYDETIDSIQKAIELINGFENLRPNDNVLIKPNIVWGAGGSKKLAKYGFISTSRIIEGIIILLREKGCNKISIGEGCIANSEVGSDTLKGFVWSGLNRVAKKHGAKLIDFNNEPHQKLKLGESNVEVAHAALDADFLIDVPVLKTHGMTKVSLGMKNLKGCLSMKSKKKFHFLNLNDMIALLNTQIKPQLTVIDGIYAMEKGPSTLGKAHRMNLIVAGKDVFSCDMVGSAILGVDPKSVDYLKRYAELNKRPIEIESVRVVGEKIIDVYKPLEWRLNYEDVFRHAGIEGISWQWVGDHCCTNCGTCADILVSCYCKDNPGIKIKPTEICFGADVIAKENSEKVILIGDCAIRANKANKNAIRVKGCPPKISDSLVTLISNTLVKKRAKRIIATRIVKGLLNKFGLYNERFPREFSYELPEFNPKHF